jgi:hypothetical protein
VEVGTAGGELKARVGGALEEKVTVAATVWVYLDSNTKLDRNFHHTKFLE